MKTQAISKLAMWLGMGIGMLVIVLFFLIGYDNPYDADPTKNAPALTDLLIFTMYAYIGILSLLTLGNLGLAVTKFKDSGLIRVITYCGGSIVIYLIFRYLICGGQEAPEGANYTGADMSLADAYIFTIYILFFAAVIVAGVCASGILTKSATKK